MYMYFNRNFLRQYENSFNFLNYTTNIISNSFAINCHVFDISSGVLASILLFVYMCTVNMYR